MAERLTHSRDGTLSLGGEERYILVPLRAYAAIINAVHDITGPAAGGPLYYIGKNIGEGLAEELGRRSRGEWRSLVENYIKLLQGLGFGEIEVRQLSDDRVVFYMKSPPSAVGAGLLGGAAERMRGGGKVCYIEAGMIAGVLSKLLGRRVVARQLQGGEGEEGGCLIEARLA